MLYLLTVKDEFDGGYDSYDSKVVRATSEAEARLLADGDTGDEGRIWEDIAKVDCEPLLVDGESAVILSSFNDG